MSDSSKDDPHNESDNAKNKPSDQVIKFPTLAERDRIRKRQEDRENNWRESYQNRKHQTNNEPFFNIGSILPFTKAISALFTLIHIALLLITDDITRLKIIYDFGFVPEHFTDLTQWQWTYILTPLSYIFIHSDWMHLGFNVIMTLALCTFVERMFSTKTTALYFFLCGLGGAATFFITNPFSPVPVIGASGAISGLFAAAMLMLYELGRLPLKGRLAKNGKLSIILIWTGIMFLIGLLSGGSIAWEAHIGGFLTGALLYHLMRKGKLRL